MQIITKSSAVRIERCPYLGLHDDASTALGFASPWNYCYRATPPASVALDHQAGACLCPAYVDCAVLLSDKWGRLPRKLRGRLSGRAGEPGIARRLARILVWLLLAAIVVLVIYLGQGFLL